MQAARRARVTARSRTCHAIRMCHAPWIAVVIFAARTGRRDVSATISLVSAPQRQTKTRCSIFANFGCCSDRSNDV